MVPLVSLFTRDVPALSTPAVVTLYNITFVTNPATCSIHLGLQTYFSGQWANNTTAGEHSIRAESCAGEAFASWNSTAGVLGSKFLNSTTLDVSSNGTLTANYVNGYNVTFNETGLLPGTAWTVNLTTNVSTTTQTGSTNFIVFVEANGTFSYTIARFTIWAAKDSGTVNVTGANVTVDINFTSIVYDVRFEAVGLPFPPTHWSITLNGTRDFSPGPFMTFAQVNGTYTYSIWTVTGFHSNITGGSVVVSGRQQNITIGFSQNTTSTAGLPAWEPYAIGGGVAIVVIAGAAFIFTRRKTPSPPSN